MFSNRSDDGRSKFSFEFFPPKSPKSSSNLFETIRHLSALKPRCVSVTCGAAGTSRQLTRDLTIQIKKKVDIPVVSHLTCVDSTRSDIEGILQNYIENDITSILALRGDPPMGEDAFCAPADGFAYASELVKFIRKSFPNVDLGVAGYPEGHHETPNRLREIEYLRRKVDAGADYICTQLFFDNHEFYDFCERCRYAGITVPIIAGIMPVTSRKGLYRMADLAAGSRIPAKLLRAVEQADSQSDVEKIGIDWATAQVADLLENDVAGIHFFTLNKYRASETVCRAITGDTFF